MGKNDIQFRNDVNKRLAKIETMLNKIAQNIANPVNLNDMIMNMPATDQMD